MSLPTVERSELPAPPQKPWLAIVIASVFLIAIGVAASEQTWRTIGGARKLERADDQAFWIETRARLREGDPDQMILLGDSRMQCDVAPEVLAARLAREAPLQLACSGATPIPALRHIAEESQFSGVVLCNVLPYFFYNPSYFSGGPQQTHIDAWNARKTGLLDAVRSWRGELSSRRRIAEIRFGVEKSPAMPVAIDRIWEVLPDRSIATYFDRADDLPALCRGWAVGIMSCPTPPIGEAEFAAQLKEYERWVGRIQARGGQVIFLRLPVSGIVAVAEEKKFPHEKYWRRFAASSSATFFDFADYPALKGFNCPDGSHLDAKDRIPFSAALAGALEDVVRRPAAK